MVFDSCQGLICWGKPMAWFMRYTSKLYSSKDFQISAYHLNDLFTNGPSFICTRSVHYALNDNSFYGFISIAISYQLLPITSEKPFFSSFTCFWLILKVFQWSIGCVAWYKEAICGKSYVSKLILHLYAKYEKWSSPGHQQRGISLLGYEWGQDPVYGTAILEIFVWWFSLYSSLQVSENDI